MKNKKITLLLFVFVLSVWGIIIYRVFWNIPQTTDSSIRLATKKQILFTDTIPSDNLFYPRTDYRNPFSNSIIEIESIKEVQQIQPVKLVSSPIITSPIWPEINYLGYVTNSKNQQRCIIMEINGKEHMLTEGEQVKGITVSRIFKDFVEVEYEKKKKFIKLKTI